MHGVATGTADQEGATMAMGSSAKVVGKDSDFGIHGIVLVGPNSTLPIEMFAGTVPVRSQKGQV